MENSIEKNHLSPETLKEINAIGKARNTMLRSREDIANYVELPLLSAAQILWDKNIKTIESSANQSDIRRGFVVMTIDFESLSEENKKVAEEIGEIYTSGDRIKIVSINIPVNENSTVKEISSKAEGFVSRFKKQPMTWVPTYTLSEFRQLFRIDPNDDSYSVEVFTNADSIKDQGWYYDTESQLFYRSKEHFEKVQESNR